jgi:hypothetical protein
MINNLLVIILLLISSLVCICVDSADVDLEDEADDLENGKWD